MAQSGPTWMPAVRKDTMTDSAIPDDYYERLGIPRSATRQQIKEAYRKKALELRPDRGENKEQFITVKEAYETLYDPVRRKAYDHGEPYLTPRKIAWTFDCITPPEPVIVRLSNRNGLNISKFGPVSMTGNSWAITGWNIIMEGDDLVDYVFSPVTDSASVATPKSLRDEARFFVEDRSVVLEISLIVKPRPSTPPSRPSVTRPPLPGTPRRSSSRWSLARLSFPSGRIILGVVVALWLTISGVLAIAESGGSSKPSKTPQQVAAEKASQESVALSTRIAELRFMCIVGTVCQTDPVGHALPVFIYAMDKQLQIYLEGHGYTDSWSDNAGFVNGHALHPSNEEAVTYVRYRAPELREGPEQEERLRKEPDGESGLIYTPPRPQEYEGNAERGLLPARMPTGQQWVITWRLKAPSGHIVTELHYALKVMNCPESNPENGSCAQPIKEQRQREEEWTSEEYNKYYPSPPPPQFPYL